MTRGRVHVCVVTGSRAEFGLLRCVVDDLQGAPDLEPVLLVTGTHLSPEFGSTIQEIERGGYTVARRVEMLLSSDTGVGMAKSMGLGVIGAADALAELQPDIVMVLGDRFEILSVALACLALRIPLAHIAGGDTTEGAIDEAIRHAITKMAHVHFVTNADSAGRVIQLGEDPVRVHVVGSPGLDQIRRATLLGRTDLEAALGSPLGPRNLLVTYHPVTLEPDNGLSGLRAMCETIEALPGETAVWITLPNADAGGRQIASALIAWAEKDAAWRHVFPSLGSVRYLSLLAQCDAMVGNSSSGLYEAPTLSVPAVDIGSRQRGRLAARSVFRCAPEPLAIAAALREALAFGRQAVQNPYGDGDASSRIIDVLRSLPPRERLLAKSFHLVGSTDA